MLEREELGIVELDNPQQRNSRKKIISANHDWILIQDATRVTNLTIPVRVRAFGLGDFVSFNKDSPDFVRVLDARAAETDDGSCRACFTASISLDLAGLRRGRGEFNLGGRGGGGIIGVVEWPSKPGRRGGGGRGPAVE